MQKQGKLSITLNKESLLIIGNTGAAGAMADYQAVEIDASKAAPWYERREDIKTVEIEEGIPVLFDRILQLY